MHYTDGDLRLDNLFVPLPGQHQAANAAVALMVASRLRQQGWALADQHLRQGLATVQWEGRLEVLERSPWVVLDAAHTVESTRRLCTALTNLFPHQRLLLVVGMASDKKVDDIIATLAPITDEVVATRFNNPRACDPQRLAALFQQHNVPAQVASDPLDALALARARATPADLICITNSLMLIGELKARLQGLPQDF
jgi:dihydrofolate synthase/folylpolyglutamate synthase